MDGRGPVQVDIWGVCTSRDIISIAGGRNCNIKVKLFFQACSFPVQFTKHVLPDVNTWDYHNEKSFFKQRMYAADINKNVPELLSQSGSEWLIVDGHVISYGIKKVIFEDGREEYFTGNLFGDRMLPYDERGYKYEIVKVDPFSGDLRDAFREFMEFCKKRYGKNIIFIEVFGTDTFLDKEGKLVFSEYSEKKLSQVFRFEREFVKETGCMVIPAPFFLTGDDCHKWGHNPVHYADEYYEYAFNAIESLIAGRPGDIESSRIECSSVMADIRSGAPSRNNYMYACYRRAPEDPESVREIEKYAGDGNPLAYGIYARLLRDGNGAIQDTAKAAEYMKKASDLGVEWAPSEYLAIIWNYFDHGKALELTLQSAGEGSKEAVMKLAREYFRGKLIPQDLDAAQMWAEKAVSMRAGDSGILLFDILWKKEDPSLYGKMIQSVLPLAERRDLPSMIRLGKAYREGKGVPEDTEKALGLFREAAGRKFASGAVNLFDTLWKVGTPESCEEAVKVIVPFSDSGSGHAQLRLGKAYRQGKGVEKDLLKAAALVESAVSKKIPGSKHEMVLIRRELSGA